MAINPETQYPGKVEPATPANPFGTARNITTPGDGTGTPWESAIQKDNWAFQHAMLINAGMEPNGTPDVADNSQLFKAAKASIGNGANLLSNHNFLDQSPDDSQPPPDATPRSYPPGFQIFSGVFANETTGITDLTYIDGRVSFTAGDFYMPVANTGIIARLASDELVASVADFDGKPRQLDSSSWPLVGDEYHVTVKVADLTGGPLGSVKFEQGSVATRHETESLSSRNLSDYTNLVFGNVGEISTSSIAASCPLGTVIKTSSYYGGWAASVYGPVGGASYIKISSADHSIVRGSVASSCLSNGIDHTLADGSVALLSLKQKSIDASIAGVVSGLGQESKIQAIIDLASTLQSGRKRKKVRLNEGIELDIVDTITLKSGVDLDVNGATIESTDLTNDDILVCDGDNTVITDGDWIGGDDATPANLRKVRAIHINKNRTTASNVTIKGEGNFYNFQTTSIYCDGDRNNIPKTIRIEGTNHFGSNKQLQAITIFCGIDVTIKNPVINSMDSLPILVDDATNTTPMDDYGVIKRVQIISPQITFDSPTNVSVIYGIQVTGCEGVIITNPQISGVPASGRGIVVTVYDLAQQKNRIENEGESGPFFSIAQRKNRVVISDGTIDGGGSGVYISGIPKPIVSNMNIRASVPLYIKKEEATISGVAYSFPSSTDDGLSPENMEGLFQSNQLIGTNASSENVFVSSNRNYFLDNVHSGEFSERYNAPNQLSTHVIRDSDQSCASATTQIAGALVSGTLTYNTGDTFKTVSLTQGSSNVIERQLGYNPSDYIVLAMPTWNTTYSVPESVKSNNGFQLNVGTASPSDGQKVLWYIVHSEDYRP